MSRGKTKKFQVKFKTLAATPTPEQKAIRIEK